MTAIERLAARVILLDADGRTLLFRGGDPTRPEDGEWWFTPGGGVEPGETLEQAARREVHEETGFELERRTVFAHRWWTVAELTATAETVYPENLPELLSAV